jgi:Ser/Thr protein kinase RdoA (MazF antagonist)
LIAGFGRLGEISARMNQHVMNWGPWQKGVGIEVETLALLSQLDRVVRDRYSALPTNRECYGLIHADLRLANLLVDSDSTAIIDFDDCGDGWYLFDLATALSFLEERPDVPDLIASWLDGYRKAGQISADIEAEIPTLIMLRRLQLIGWVGYQQRYLKFAREIGSDFTTDSCRLAEEYLTRFT